MSEKFHAAFFQRAKEMLPQWLFGQIRASAVPLSGANARWTPTNPTVFEKLAIPHLRPERLRDLEDTELSSALKRLNKIYLSAKRTKKSDTRPFVKAAVWVVNEMKERELSVDDKLKILQEFVDKENVEKTLDAEMSNMFPRSKRGLTTADTFQAMDSMGRKWSQEEANYVPRTRVPFAACGACRFYLRDEESAVGRCQVVDGPINWFGTSDLYISATEESIASFRQADIEAREQFLDQAFGVEKAYESPGSDDDNNTDRKKPRVVTAAQIVAKRIKREGDEYLVTDDSGKKVLGRHKTREAAVRQLAAIEARLETEKGQPTVSQVGQRRSPKRDPELDRELSRYTKEDLQKENIEIDVPIAKVDSKLQKIYGIVLEPDEVDTQNDTISAEEIEKAAEGFMQRSRVIGERHQKQARGVVLTDSYVTQGPTRLGSTTLKKGTWIIGVKVTDSALWSRVEAGEFTGFSVGGRGNRLSNS